MSIECSRGDGGKRRVGARARINRHSKLSLLEPVLELSRALSPENDSPQPVPGTPIATSVAMRELLTVHRIEQARLVLRASRLRALSTPLGRLFLALSALDLRESSWCGEAAEELDACLFDGWEASTVLAECAARPRTDWPSTRELARAAHALEPSVATRLQLARAELCEGSIGKALEMLQALHATHPAGRCDRELRESLALASEAQGRWTDASAHYRVMCARIDARPAAHAASLVSALRLGDLRRASADRTRLIENVESMLEDDLRLTQDLSRLRARIQFHRSQGSWQYTDDVRAWIQAWQRAGSAGLAGRGGRVTAALTRALL